MVLEAFNETGYTRPVRRKVSKAFEEAKQLPGLWTVHQAADEKGVSTTAIYNAIYGGSLHPQRIGEVLILFQWEVEAWTPPRRGPKPRRRARKPLEREPDASR